MTVPGQYQPHDGGPADAADVGVLNAAGGVIHEVHVHQGAQDDPRRDLESGVESL